MRSPGALYHDRHPPRAAERLSPDAAARDAFAKDAFAKDAIARDAFAAILGEDAALLESVRMAARFAPTSLPVLLLAETGTGKELFARAVHAASPRNAGPFVPLNCGALSPSLLESELFGHAPGAFTGAQRAGSAGKLAAADGGTLFLDEIAEMPETLQATLLRVLEDGSYYRVGESRPRQTDFRLVCATCRDLPSLVRTGRFRRDLFFRIQGACITIPPLSRRTDKVPLARGLLAQLAAESGAPEKALSECAIAWIEAHSFPGNVRELKTALAHARVMAGGDPVIDAACFPRLLLGDTAPLLAEDMPFAEALAKTPVRRRDDAIDEMMRATLRACAGNVSEAARRLGVARSTLYRHMASPGSGKERDPGASRSRADAEGIRRRAPNTASLDQGDSPGVGAPTANDPGDPSGAEGLTRARL